MISIATEQLALSVTKGSLDLLGVTSHGTMPASGA